MIDLNIQLSIILFSIIYGIYFYLLLYLCRNYINYNNTFFRIINTISFILFMTIVYFIGIQIICSGILHLYSLLIITLVCLLCNTIAKKLK